MNCGCSLCFSCSFDESLWGTQGKHLSVHVYSVCHKKEKLPGSFFSLMCQIKHEANMTRRNHSIDLSTFSFSKFECSCYCFFMAHSVPLFIFVHIYEI